MSKLLITLVLAIVILDLLLEADASFGCPRNKYTCIRACKARKYTTGYCRGSVCRCKKSVCPSLPKFCRLLCYRHGYKKGYCSGRTCRCYRKACPKTSLYCDYSCRIDTRFFKGKCFGSRCLCYRRRG